MTLYELVEAQSARLREAGVSFGHGTTNAFDEAAWLVLHTLRIGFDAFEAQARRPVTPAEQARAEALVGERIATRKPAAYLIGEAWLQNVPFTVDERVIVPRSFIAELLADGEQTGILDAWLSEDTRRVLDLCTGNGSLAVIAALAYPEVTVDACDLSADALEVARLNVERHRLGGRIRLFESDLFSRVATGSMQSLPPEYRHEPRIALDGNVAGGADGMDLVRRIVADAPGHLSDIGVLVLEIGHERANFERAFPRLETAWLETSAGDDQVLLLTKQALLDWQRRAERTS
ncbi:MAG: 50S ribosomal protein L3 N(5)-glutamine methyltransferase [Ideonella sp.]|nr:50S ribosomal protein L3 N(5)-glutamine methyltransferase [Ideonella sp.]